MVGNPKYNFGDTVSFTLRDGTRTGKIHIIDKNGTFYDSSDVSYDIMVTDAKHPEGCLFKHVNERLITGKVNETV